MIWWWMDVGCLKIKCSPCQIEGGRHVVDMRLIPQLLHSAAGVAVWPCLTQAGVTREVDSSMFRITCSLEICAKTHWHWSTYSSGQSYLSSLHVQHIHIRLAMSWCSQRAFHPREAANMSQQTTNVDEAKDAECHECGLDRYIINKLRVLRKHTTYCTNSTWYCCDTGILF